VSRKLRIGVVVVVSLAVVAGSLIGFLSSHARAATDRTGATPKKYTAAATLKAVAGSHARGTFAGQVTGTTSGTSGTLRWKVTYTGLSGPVTGVLLKQGAKVLAHLCSSSCKSGVQKSSALHGATFRAAVGNKTTIAVATKAHATGELNGALKLKASSVTGGGGGGGTTVAVTPAAVAAGKKLAAHFSCTGCHTIDGTKSTGPTWKGLAGSKVPQTDGSTVIATDAYLIRVITDPSTLKVKGYDSGVMSEVIAPGTVSDAEARNIVAYIKSIK
jgi:cytochrome c1